MQNVQPSLLTRDDTFFGVCEGLGEDLHIPPNLLRLALAGMLFWNPLAAAGTYAVAGAIVLCSRLLFPNPRLPVEAQGEEPASITGNPEQGAPADDRLLEAA